MQRLKIIADDKIPFLKGVMEPYADIIYLPGAKISAGDVKDADAIFTRTRTRCDESLLKNSRVKLIATATIGYDHIDTDYCDTAGIRWVNAPGCNSWSVQQYITTAIVSLAYQRGLRLPELTLGVIGVGNVGSKVARAAEALGMRVLLNDPPRADQEGTEAFTPLDRLLAGSDIVTCHTPLTKEAPYPTYHLASGEFFNRMKDGSVFINTSRGPVTDTEALKLAVKTKLSGYILDVWEGEPLPDPSLLADAYIGTPHIAGYSSDGKANGTAACVHEFCSFFGLDVLKDWYPESIPPPPMPTTFSIDGAGKSNEQIIYEAVTHTYPIREDNDRLKKSPETFEEQRGGYWIRREFKNFTIKSKNIDIAVLKSLNGIGFKIDSDD
ncbi:MAG: 4-phosphoerythronate dehydrogenase [Tannerella sp.]|jgi:erythronate-4-phosphate dehydrogenase|nr:4-phosphoerythronate dehydrogenase [Tannerella sp.]